MVSATFALSVVITNTPSKLNMAAIIIAALGLMERVEIHVAMAFGASVQPLTMMVPKVRTTVITSGGLFSKFNMNSFKLTVISSSSKYFFLMKK